MSSNQPQLTSHWCSSHWSFTDKMSLHIQIYNKCKVQTQDLFSLFIGNTMELQVNICGFLFTFLHKAFLRKGFNVEGKKLLNLGSLTDVYFLRSISLRLTTVNIQTYKSYSINTSTKCGEGQFVNAQGLASDIAVGVGRTVYYLNLSIDFFKLASLTQALRAP